MSRIVLLFNKPYGVLSQFTDAGDRKTLADYIDVPEVYAAGRLDKNSEGLLVLTNDGKLQAKISNPQYRKEKHYWVQVEGEVSQDALRQLRAGVSLKDGRTKPAKVAVIAEPAQLWERQPPIRERKAIPTQWLNVVIQEGRNRQVRRMTAAVGNPTLRLIRYQIGQWSLEDLPQGAYKMVNAN